MFISGKPIGSSWALGGTIVGVMLTSSFSLYFWSSAGKIAQSASSISGVGPGGLKLGCCEIASGRGVTGTGMGTGARGRDGKGIGS